MYKLNITGDKGDFLFETMCETEHDAQIRAGEYLADKHVNLDGVKHIKIERIYIDETERYRKALEDIASQPKIESIGYGSEDNSFYVETAREALGWPTNIAKYDNPE